uniref:Actin-related protein 2/3 complex subunit 4 n=1 Tax=Phaeocystis cordata TaxID=118079 RepID=A0A7S1HR59_9EUKA
MNAALCLQNFASQIVERHNKPEVEVGTSPELILNPITIHRSEIEYTQIEPSVNSVRVSIKVKQIDEMDSILANKFSRFLMQRADNFIVLRRKPISGFDLSFLLTNFNLENMYKHKLVDFVVQFMEEIDSEISAMKIQVNERARMIAFQYLKEFCT